jgi:hypothetical protein
MRKLGLSFQGLCCVEIGVCYLYHFSFARWKYERNRQKWYVRDIYSSASDTCSQNNGINRCCDLMEPKVSCSVVIKRSECEVFHVLCVFVRRQGNLLDKVYSARRDVSTCCRVLMLWPGLWKLCNLKLPADRQSVAFTMVGPSVLAVRCEETFCCG